MASSLAGNGKVTLPLISSHPSSRATSAPAIALGPGPEPTAPGPGPAAPAPAPDSSSTRPSPSSPVPDIQPPPAPISALENLPFELLQPIVQALVPAPPSTTRFALRPEGTWELHDANHQYATWLRAHNGLLAFACTSRQMAAFTTPFLYQTIVVHNARGLVKLYLRMRHRPEIRPLIRNLACLVNVLGERMIESLHDEWLDQAGVPWLRRHAMYTAKPDMIGLDMLETIIYSAPNLRDLLIAFPDHDLLDDGGNAPDWLAPGFTSNLEEYNTSTNYPYSVTRVRGTDYLNYLLYVNKLTSLRIYCNREGFEREHTYSRFLADCAVGALYLPGFQTLRTLELCCSSFGRYAQDPVTLQPMPHIEHLRFYGSYIREPRLTAVVLACTKLQTLLVHFEHSTVDEDRDLLPGGITLNDALRGVASTLRTLELVALGQGHYITRGRERPRKPENHRLTCIPDLHQLTDLTLDYRGVFGTLGILEEDDGERLCQLLPSSVRHFTLECEWGTSKDWKRSYQADLDVMLYGVGCLCSAESLNLESISLAIHSWPAQSRFHRRFRREMERARLRCAEAGIKFRTFDILPSYMDEDQVEQDEEDEGEDEDDAHGDGEAIPAVAAEGGEGTGEELELEEEDEASEYYMSSGDDEPDPEREAMRPATFDEFLERLGDGHGHNLDELFFAYHEDRWDEYLF